MGRLPQLIMLALAIAGLPALETPSGVVAILRSDRGGEEPGGSAVVIAADGTALSLAEALPAEATSVVVVLPGGARRSAQVVKRDADSTAVLLRIDDLPPALRPLPLADSRRVQVLDPVWTVGNAAGAIELDGEAALSHGVASGSYDIPAGTPPVRGRGGREVSAYRGAAIETDAAINDGNEGGALLDEAGRLIGLVSRGQARERRLPVAVPLARVLAALGLPLAEAAPAGGGAAWRSAAESAAGALALVYFERVNGLGNPDGVPRPPRAVADAPEADREQLQNWWDNYFHQQQVFFTDQPVCALSLGGNLLLTAASNLHGGVRNGRVLLPDGAIECRVVARDLPLDLALLQTASPHGLPPARFATTAPALGQDVVLLGRHRADSAWTATLGCISATTRRQLKINQPFLQTDARADYGSLGGILVAGDGAVVGMLVRLGPEYPWLINSGVAIAVDAERIAQALPDLREGHDRERSPTPLLGLVLEPKGEAVVVNAVVSGSGAEAAGLRHGDLIQTVDGVKARNHIAVMRAVLRHQPGDRVVVVLKRAGADMTVEVELRVDQTP